MKLRLRHVVIVISCVAIVGILIICRVNVSKIYEANTYYTTVKNGDDYRNASKLCKGKDKITDSTKVEVKVGDDGITEGKIITGDRESKVLYEPVISKIGTVYAMCGLDEGGEIKEITFSDNQISEPYWVDGEIDALEWVGTTKLGTLKYNENTKEYHLYFRGKQVASFDVGEKLYFSSEKCSSGITENGTIYEIICTNSPSWEIKPIKVVENADNIMWNEEDEITTYIKDDEYYVVYPQNESSLKNRGIPEKDGKTSGNEQAKFQCKKLDILDFDYCIVDYDFDLVGYEVKACKIVGNSLAMIKLREPVIERNYLGVIIPQSELQSYTGTEIEAIKFYRWVDGFNAFQEQWENEHASEIAEKIKSSAWLQDQVTEKWGVLEFKEKYPQYFEK